MGIGMGVEEFRKKESRIEERDEEKKIMTIPMTSTPPFVRKGSISHREGAGMNSSQQSDPEKEKKKGRLFNSNISGSKEAPTPSFKSNFNSTSTSPCNSAFGSTLATNPPIPTVGSILTTPTPISAPTPIIPDQVATTKGHEPSSSPPPCSTTSSVPKHTTAPSSEGPTSAPMARKHSPLHRQLYTQGIRSDHSQEQQQEQHQQNHYQQQVYGSGRQSTSVSSNSRGNSITNVKVNGRVEMMNDSVDSLAFSEATAPTTAVRRGGKASSSREGGSGSGYAMPSYSLPLPAHGTATYGGGRGRDFTPTIRPPASRQQATLPTQATVTDTTMKHTGSDTGSVRSARSNTSSTITTAPSGPRRTLASLYVVCGLPKDPQTWSFVIDSASSSGSNANGGGDRGRSEQPSHMENAVPRFFKAECLGTMVSGGKESALESLDSMASASGSGSGMGIASGSVGRAQGRGSSTGIGVGGVSGSGSGTRRMKGVRGGMKVPPTIEEQPLPGLSKEEVAKVQAKAIKVSSSFFHVSSCLRTSTIVE